MNIHKTKPLPSLEEIDPDYAAKFATRVKLQAEKRDLVVEAGRIREAIARGSLETRSAMPARRRVDKRRTVLCESAQAWLRGEPGGFFRYKPYDELVDLWRTYGDDSVATWDERRHTMPSAVTK